MANCFKWRPFFRRRSLEPLPWLPPAIDEPVEEDGATTISPLAAPVHVRSGAAVVRIDNGLLLVERDGGPRFERPVELVAALHIHGPATITTPCIAQLIAQGTPVLWRSTNGFPIACVNPMHQAGLEARRAQYA